MEVLNVAIVADLVSELVKYLAIIGLPDCLSRVDAVNIIKNIIDIIIRNDLISVFYY